MYLYGAICRISCGDGARNFKWVEDIFHCCILELNKDPHRTPTPLTYFTESARIYSFFKKRRLKMSKWMDECWLVVQSTLSAQSDEKKCTKHNTLRKCRHIPAFPFNCFWELKFHCLAGVGTLIQYSYLEVKKHSSAVEDFLPELVSQSPSCAPCFLKGKIPCHTGPWVRICCPVGWVPPAFVGMSLVEVRAVGIWVAAVKTEH